MTLLENDIPRPPDTEIIRGLSVSNLPFEDVVKVLLDWADRHDRTRYFACVNPHSAELAHRDAVFMAALHDADMLVADGAGVLLASLILGGRIRERSTGPDLFLAVMKALNETGTKSVFYLGGGSDSLHRLDAHHRERFPRVRIAGLHAPPFRKAFTADDLADIVARIDAAAPDVLWVGVGAPKQEKLLHDLRDRISVPLCGPIGAMFDYFAGTVRPPPRWMARAGFHWLYRLVRNPRRMWRRNLDTPVFLARVLADRLRQQWPA